MAYPDFYQPRSIAGAAAPTYIAVTVPSGYATSQTITLATTSGWYEVSSSGTPTTNPLGTSGIFTIVVDYGSAAEEKILCASGAITIGSNVPVTVWTDGVNNGRGYDSTTSYAHAVGSGTVLNVFPVRTAVDDLQYNDAAIVLGYASQYLATQQLIDEGNLSAVSGSVTTLSGQFVVLSGQVATQSNYITIVSGNQATDAANIATLSGQFVTLSGSYNTTSGIVTNQTDYISTISGKQVTDEANIATLSGQMVTANDNISTNAVNIATLSGQYVTTSGIVTNHTSYIATISGKQVTDEANIASISGSLVTVSGVAYAALPRTGGTISGNLTVTGTLAVNSTNIALGANTPISSANAAGVAIGNYAGQTSNNNGVAVGAYAGSTQNFEGVAIGYEAGYYYNEFGVAIGYLANINNTGSKYTTAIGYQVNATASGSVAIGTDHTGAGATSSTQDQIVLGTANHNVNVPGTLTVSGINVLTSISGVTAGGDLQGTYPNPTISTALSGTISTNTTNIATLSGSLVTTNSNVATISGKQITDEANIASLSGSLATLSGQYVATSGIVTSNTSNIASTSGSLSTLSGQFVTLSGQYYTTSGIVTNQAGYIATISGKQITDENNIASLSGSLNTLSGQYVATSGIVTNHTSYIATISGNQVADEANIASISGSLATVSGVAYAALPKAGGTISGNLTVTGTLTAGSLTVSGGNVLISGSTANGDLSGTYPSPTVAKIQGTSVSPTAPSNNQVLRYSTASGAWYAGTGNALFPTATISGNYTATPNDYAVVNATVAPITITLPNAPANGSVVSVASLSTSTYNVVITASGSDTIPDGNFTLAGNTVFNSVSFYYDSARTEWLISSNQFGDVAGGDLGGYYPNPTVNSLQGTPVSNIPPNTGQVLASVGGVWTPITSSGVGTPGPGGANGYWFAGYDTTNQTITTVLSGKPILIGTPTNQNGIVSSASGTITIGYTGTYNFQFSVQFQNSDNAAHNANVWLRKNGTDVAETNGTIAIPRTGGTGNGYTISSWNYIVAASGGDNFQFMWTTDDTHVSIIDVAGLGTAPDSPGFIATVQQVMYNQTGTYTVNAIAASGTNQATATPLTLSTYAPVTGATASGNTLAGTGVVLGTPTYNGQWAQVHNQSTTGWLLVYPASGAIIDQEAANGPIWIPPSAFWEGVATTTLSWDTKIQPVTSTTINVNYEANGGQTAIELPSVGSPSTYGTASGVAVVTTDAQGRVSNVTVTGIQIAQNQVTGLSGNLSALSGSISTTNSNLATLSGQYATTSGIVTNQTGYISTLSGQMVTANANIASTSGSLATLSGQYVTTSGIVTTNTSNIATLSGQMVTANSNIASTSGSLATLSGQFVTLSGSYNTTSGIVTTNTNNIATLSGQMVTANNNIASLSGSLNTVSGVAYAALPRTGGTISGNLTVTGTTTVNSITNQGNTVISGSLTTFGNTILSGTNLNIYSNTIGGVAAASGQALIYSGGQWVPGTVSIAANSNALANTYYTNVSGAQGPINIYTATASGFLLFNYYAKVTATGTTSKLGPITLTSTDPDGNTIVNTGNSTSANSTVSGFINGVIPVLVASGSTVSYSMVYASSGTSMQYEVYTQLASSNLSVSSGVVSSFNGRTGAVLPSVGDYSSVVATDNRTSQSGAIGPINLTTTTASGIYQVNYYAKVTTTGTSSTLGPIVVTSVDPDGTTITTSGYYTSSNTLANGVINGIIPVYVASGTVVSYSIGYTSPSSAMKYESFVTLNATTLAPVSTGAVSSFNGRTGAVLPSVGDYTSIIATDNRTSQSGSIASFALATSSGTGFYFFNHYAKITTAGSAGSVLGPVSITTVDPDGTTVTNFGPFTSNNTITSGIINTVIPVYVASGTNITYSLGYTSSGSTMKYESYGMLSSAQVAPAVSIAVTSFNGRTGAITPAIGDYTASQVGALPILGGTISGNLVVTSGLTISGTITETGTTIVTQTGGAFSTNDDEIMTIMGAF